MVRIYARVSFTILFIVAAIFAGQWVWKHYLYSPWTRDGRIRAEVITVAPDVAGWVTTVNFTDNENVKKGQVLFSIDTMRFRNNVEEAKAEMDRTHYALKHANEQYNRRSRLRQRALISKDDLSTYRINSNLAKADYELARIHYEKTLIDLKRTVILAPADGTVMNLNLRSGNYAEQGKAVLSLVKKNSMYVTGYFEETKLPLINLGDTAHIRLMSGGTALTGEVVSIARAIANTNTATDTQLLPATQQTFNWVRLAQRIPVDIRLTHIPSKTLLSAGMTASVEIDKKW